MREFYSDRLNYLKKIAPRVGEEHDAKAELQNIVRFAHDGMRRRLQQTSDRPRTPFALFVGSTATNSEVQT